MAGNFYNNPNPQHLDSNGDPFSGGKLEYFEAGSTTTDQDTFTDQDLTPGNENPNPVILDSSGRSPTAIFLQQKSYNVRLLDSLNNVIWARDNVSNVIQVSLSTLDTIGDLTALVESTLVDGAVEDVNGYFTSGDTGGGRFRWDAASTATVNGGTVFEPDITDGTGRWLRIVDDYVTLRMFGAKIDFNATTFTGTDDTVRVQAAIDWAGASGVLRETKNQGNCKIVGNPAIQFDQAFNNIDIDFGAITFYYDDGAGLGGTGVAIEIGGGATGPFSRHWESKYRGIRVFRRIAAGDFASTLVGTAIKLINVGESSFQDFRVMGFEKGYALEPGTTGQAVTINNFFNLVAQSCKFNIYTEPDATSTNCFVTANKFFGGYLVTDETMFTNIVTAGAHLFSLRNPGRALSGNAVDGNTFYGITAEEAVTRKIFCEGNGNSWIDCYLDTGTYLSGNTHASGIYPFLQSAIGGFVATVGSPIITKVAHGLAAFVSVGDVWSVTSHTTDMNDTGNYVITAIATDTLTLNHDFASAGTVVSEHASANIEFTADGDSNTVRVPTLGFQAISSVATKQNNILRDGGLNSKGPLPGLGTRGGPGVPAGLIDSGQPTLFNFRDKPTPGTGTLVSYLGNLSDDDTNANIRLSFSALDTNDRESVFAAIEANKEGRNTSTAFGGLDFKVRAPTTNQNLVNAAQMDNLQNVTAGRGTHLAADTSGHFYIPTTDTTPTGVPTVKSGFVAITYSLATNEIFVYDDAWLKIAVA